MTEPRLLDRDTLMQALTRLDARLRARRLVCRVYLFGGAAILTVFPERLATHDADARFDSTEAVQWEVMAVAREMGLPDGWLNERGVMYLPRQDDPASPPVYDAANLQVLRASDRQLLAMKASASRSERDSATARTSGCWPIGSGSRRCSR